MAVTDPLVELFVTRHAAMGVAIDTKVLIEALSLCLTRSVLDMGERCPKRSLAALLVPLSPRHEAFRRRSRLPGVTLRT